MNSFVEIVAVIASFLALSGAAAFFTFEKKLAGSAFLVAFVVAFSALVGQRVVFSSALVGVTVEKNTSATVQKLKEF